MENKEKTFFRLITDLSVKTNYHHLDIRLQAQRNGVRELMELIEYYEDLIKKGQLPKNNPVRKHLENPQKKALINNWYDLIAQCNILSGKPRLIDCKRFLEIVGEDRDYDKRVADIYRQALLDYSMGKVNSIEKGMGAMDGNTKRDPNDPRQSPKTYEKAKEILFNLLYEKNLTNAIGLVQEDGAYEEDIIRDGQKVGHRWVEPDYKTLHTAFQTYKFFALDEILMNGLLSPEPEETFYRVKPSHLEQYFDVKGFPDLPEQVWCWGIRDVAVVEPQVIKSVANLEFR